MTTPTIETRVIKNEEGIDFRGVRANAGDIFERENPPETVREATYDGERLVLLRTLRRKKSRAISGGVIIETVYSVDSRTGELSSSGSGIYCEKDNSSFHASARYGKLDKFLTELEQ
jgi:hypothetical protein